MTVIPNQPFGLGDIIFTQTLVRRIANGNPIVWPVFPQFVDQLNGAYPDIKFVDWRGLLIDYGRKDQYETYVTGIGHNDKCTVLPIRFASEILGGNYTTWMSDKYKLYGMDYRDWVNDAMWRSTPEKRSGLFQAMHPGVDYALINNTFGSDCKLHIDIPKSGIMPLYMDVVAGYSLFDWATIITSATAIHTVNTSIIYLLEMLNLKAKEVHLYQRSIPGQTFAGVDYLLKRHKYVYHG